MPAAADPTATGEATGAATAAPNEDRIVTVPNLLSVIRLLCIPLFLYLLFGRDDRARAAYLMGALGATDWVDGFIARRFNQVSNLGKVLDPTADRLLLGVALVALIIDGSAPRWVAALVLAREAVVALAVLALAAAGASRIDVTWFGKAGTFCNLFAFPFFLGGASGISWNDISWTLGWVFAIPGLLLSYYAAALYIPLARKALREGREGAADTATDAGAIT